MKNLLLWIVSTVLISNVFGQEDGALVELAKKGFEARAKAPGLREGNAAVMAFRKPLEGLDDSKKIRALALYLYDIDQTNAKWSMSANITSAPESVLTFDPEFIKDWSALRQMLHNERDPRKFYLLSRLVPLIENSQQYDFIAERTHMLFADGRVAKDEGEYTKSYAHDVSRYAYTAIVGRLKALDADFEPPSNDLSHEQQALILAKWLKDHWPGCENMKIPERLPNDSPGPTKSHVGAPPGNQAQNVLISPEAAKAESNTRTPTEGNRIPWFLAVSILAVILGFLVKLRRSS